MKYVVEVDQYRQLYNIDNLSQHNISQPAGERNEIQSIYQNDYQ